MAIIDAVLKVVTIVSLVTGPFVYHRLAIIRQEREKNPNRRSFWEFPNWLLLLNPVLCVLFAVLPSYELALFSFRSTMSGPETINACIDVLFLACLGWFALKGLADLFFAVHEFRSENKRSGK